MSPGFVGFLLASVILHPLDPAFPAERQASRSGLPEGLSSSDLCDIRTAYEASRHSAYAVQGGYEARNPGRRWRTSFDGRGFTIEPDVGGWTWGLELKSYGFRGRQLEVVTPDVVSAQGQRLAYCWGTPLEEWYVNDARGMEHGYTVHERPPRGVGALTFELELRGDLDPRVQAGGRGVDFLNAAREVILSYGGLTVFDATGRNLAARMESVPGGLLLRVEEQEAVYPLTIDPLVQQAYLKASNPDFDDAFSVTAVSGDTVVVGAYLENSSATGVNGNQSDNSATDSGAAYVFVRSGTAWSQQAYLKASNTGAADHFGQSVSVSGDTIVIGAPDEDSNATGANGNQSSNSMSGSGAVYVFVRSGTTWSQQAYLKASNTGADDHFGQSVSVSGDTIVVGAPSEDSNATGVNGNESDNSIDNSGAAYVFVRSGTAWSQQAYVKASNPDIVDGFGRYAQLSGDTLVVGADGEDSNATGVNGNQGDNSATESGAAYVFVRSGTTWSQQAYLKASNTGGFDYFGRVAVSGDTIVVGAYSEDSNATGVNGNQGDNSAADSGAAYVFVRSGATWSQQAYLKASNTGAGDLFGISVGVSGDKVVIGANSEDSDANGINGSQSGNAEVDTGAAYAFVRTGTSWSQFAYLKASYSDPWDLFGWDVGISGDTLVVTARYEDSGATGANGDQLDGSAAQSGAAYAFDLDPTGGTAGVYCFGDGTGNACPCGNIGFPGHGCRSSATPWGGMLNAIGFASVTADSVLLLGTNMPAGKLSLYFQGTTRLGGGLGVPVSDGLNCAGGGGSIRLGSMTTTNPGGTSFYPNPGLGHLPVSIRGAIPPAGATRYYTIWYRDGPSICGAVSAVNFTNGYTLLWVP